MKMISKKRWLNGIYPESQSRNTPINISWSTSESEEEKEVDTKKSKIDNLNCVSSTGWIKRYNEKQFINEIERDIEQSTSKQFESISCNFKKVSHNLHENNTTPLNKGCNSPVFSNIPVEELSPVLFQTTTNYNISNEESPILGNKQHILKTIRSKYKKANETKQIDEDSPDLFTTKSMQVTDCYSVEYKPNLKSLEYNDVIHSTKRIDLFPSQYSSQTTNSVVDSRSSKNDNTLLYHQPAPRRKRYKKGGLAFLLQKALHLQRTRVSIWQHEMYTKKVDNINSDGDVIDFVVENKWKEYGNTILECSAIDSLQSKSICISNSTCFLTIIGFSTNINIFEIKSKYKLFPPYSTKTIIYKSKEVFCFFNTVKIAAL